MQEKIEYIEKSKVNPETQPVLDHKIKYKVKTCKAKQETLFLKQQMIKDLQIALKDKVHQFIKEAKTTIKLYDDEISSIGQDANLDEELKDEPEENKISAFN